MLVAPFTWWVAWSGEVLTEFHLEVPLLTETWDFTFIFSCTLTLPTVFSFALNASRNDWFCNMTSGVENLLASFLSSEMRLLLCDDPPEVNVEFSKWRLEGELLLLKLQEETRWYNHWVYVDIFVHISKMIWNRYRTLIRYLLLALALKYCFRFSRNFSPKPYISPSGDNLSLVLVVVPGRRK